MNIYSNSLAFINDFDYGSHGMDFIEYTERYLCTTHRKEDFFSLERRDLYLPTNLSHPIFLFNIYFTLNSTIKRTALVTGRYVKVY